MDRAIVQVLLVYSVGFLVRYALSAVGDKQLAGALKVVTVMICVSIAAPAVWEMISGVAETLANIKGWFEAAEEKVSILEWLIWFGAPGGKPE